MAKKLRVDGSFRNSSAVDGNVWTVFAGTMFVDDFREILLTHTALTGDQYLQIGGGHLHRNADGTVQLGIKTDDTETLLDGSCVDFHY